MNLFRHSGVSRHLQLSVDKSKDMNESFNLLIIMILVAVAADVTEGVDTAKVQSMDLQMPNASIHKNNSFLCHSVKITTAQPIYIVGFSPLLTPHSRHVTFSACMRPGSDEEVWSCGHVVDSDYSAGQVCGERYSPFYLYLWEIDGAGYFLPPDVGYEVGGGTAVGYLVIQVHYINIKGDPKGDEMQDSTGVRFYYSDERPKYLAGVLLLYTGVIIQPYQTEHVEIACPVAIPKNSSINIYTYRVHTHGGGIVVSGYRVRSNEWTEIGRRSPQKSPHEYSPTNVSMTANDYIAARCTINNPRNRMVTGGDTLEQEMCVFASFFYTESGPHEPFLACFNSGPPAYYWKTDRRIDLSNPPADASDVPPETQPLHTGPNDQM